MFNLLVQVDNVQTFTNFIYFIISIKIGHFNIL